MKERAGPQEEGPRNTMVHTGGKDSPSPTNQWPWTQVAAHEGKGVTSYFKNHWTLGLI